MNFTFYKPEALIKSREVVFCNTTEECDKIERLGWNATTLIDPGNPKDDDKGKGWMGWILHSNINHQGLAAALKKSRIIFFPHQNDFGTEASLAIEIELIGFIIDLRIVDIPVGITLTDFLNTCCSEKEAQASIKKLIDHSIPLSTQGMADCYSDIRSVHRRIKLYSELHELKTSFLEFEGSFRQMARRESNRKIKEINPELLGKSR